jgi:hypothetical protein
MSTQYCATLRVGDALHPAEHGVEGDDQHADGDAGLHGHFEEAAEHDAHAAHLPRHVGEADEDRRHDGDQPRGPRVVAIADEIRHRVLAELPEERREQQRQEHVAARPPHQVHGAVVAEERDDAGHGDEAGGAHPVGGRGHPVGDGRDALAGHVEAGGGAHTRQDRDRDVQGEGEPDDHVRPLGDAHHRCSRTPTRTTHEWCG